MALSHDAEVEGVTTFSTSPATSYRYILRLKDDKLSIWMEDRTSKKQWCNTGVTKEDYVTSSNAISDASAMEYLRFFQDALGSGHDESGDAQRTLKSLSGDSCKLVLSVKVRILSSVRVVKYAFVLDAVSMDRIDVLESRVRDQQEELERLGKQSIMHIHLEASTTHVTSQKLMWSDSDSDNFLVDQETGDVSIDRPGVYSITAVFGIGGIQNFSSTCVSIVKNQDIISSGNRTGQFVTASTIARFDANDVLAVKSTRITSTSYFFIMQIGS